MFLSYCMKYIQLYLISTLIFFAIDMFWLGFLAKDFYREKLGYLMAPKVNWTAALIFYFIYIAGILFFAVIPGLNSGNFTTVLLNGAVLGFLCYATYDLTNLATVKNWPFAVVWVDILWGTILTGATAVLSFLLAQRFLTW